MRLTVSKWQAKAGNNLEANGLIRINPNKPEYGSLMLIATTMNVSNGFLNKKNKVAFIVGRVTDLQSMIDNFELKEGDDYSKKVAPHRIVTIEKVLSEIGSKDLGFREKINPTTGDILTKDGEPIMWKTEVVAEGSDVFDTFIKHDTVTTEDPAIKEFSGAESEMSR